MKTVTLKEVISWGPCWLEKMGGRDRLERIGRRKEQWTALDVLALPGDEVSVDEKFWVVLRPELIPEPILHEFACRCAEEALKLVENPDPRSIAAIEAKRRWLRGEISDDELKSAARAAAARVTARATARAADVAYAAADAADAARAVDAARAAAYAALAARADAYYAARADAYPAVPPHKPVLRPSHRLRHPHPDPVLYRGLHQRDGRDIQIAGKCLSLSLQSPDRNQRNRACGSCNPYGIRRTRHE